MASTHQPQIVPATEDRWEDLCDLLGVSGEAGCWCQAWRGHDTKARSGGRSRPELLRDQMAQAQVAAAEMTGRHPPPGYLAYLGDLAVGWIGVSVRTETPRLVNSRTIPAVDDQPVWSVGCFQVRPGYRRRGITRALLAGVINQAKEAGAPGIEAYPIDPGARRVEVGAGFVGIASIFDAAGFRRLLTTDAHSGGLPRLLVRLDFD